MSFATALERLEELRTRGLERLGQVGAPALAVAFAAFVIFQMLQRLALGVDFTDESFSTGLAYRFALGDRPFIDELNAAQTAGIILTPFVWLYLKVTGSAAGIMMFTRLLFLVFKLGVSAAVFATVRRHLSWPLALVTSLVGVVFVPHSIPNLGYNVLGSGFLVIGGFVGVRGFGSAKQRRALFWAGVCNGLATLAYPPLVVPAVVLGVVIVVAAESSVRDFGEFVGGGVLVALCVMPLLLAAGGKNLQAMLEMGARFSPRTPTKLFEIVVAFWAHSPVSLWVLPTLAIVIAALKLRPAWGVWVLPIFTATLALAFPPGNTSQLSIAIYAALFAPVFLVVLWHLPVCRALFAVVWVPSFVAGFITAYTSSNGELNGGIGFFPAAVLFLVYQAIAVEQLWREGAPDPERSARAPLLLLGPAILVLSLLARFTFSVYRDAALPELRTRVESGPFRGLTTTADNASVSSELERLFRTHENRAGRVLVYWDMPGAYLFTSMRPAGNTLWMNTLADQDAFLASYRRSINGSGFAIKVKASGAKGAPIDQFLETSGRPLDASPRFLLTAEPVR